MSVESIVAELKEEISALSDIYADRGMYDTKAEEIVYLDPAEDDGESYCDNAIFQAKLDVLRKLEQL